MSGPQVDPADHRARDAIPIQRALISVSDKTGLVELVKALGAAGVDIVSTGSTAGVIRDAGVAVTEVAEVTGFPESLGGRVRTLHPAIHAGLLADLRLESHEQELAGLGFEPFQLVVSNLYPFVQTVASGAGFDDVIEQIDIGGPALVRAAAKNHANVAVVTSPASYAQVVKALQLGGTTLAQRRRLAAEAFAHTAAYDAAVAAWFADQGATGSLTLDLRLQQNLRYGENAHQTAALYVEADGHGIAQATQLGGKEMSYNNYVDADAAVRAAYDFDEPCVAIIKHANPCGIAIANTIAEAHAKAHACDPVSAFGGVIAANRPITREAAESIKDVFTEVVVAPGFEPEALEILTAKKNLRLLQLPGRVPPADPRGPPDQRRRARPVGRFLRRVRLVDLAARRRRRGRCRDPRRPGVRLAGGALGEVQRHPARARRRIRGHRDGPGQPGGLVRARRAPRRRPRGRIGRGERRVLPVRRRPRHPHRSRGPCDRAAGGLDARR